MSAFSSWRCPRLLRAGATFLLISGCLVATAPAQIGSQFNPPSTPPYTLDNVQGEWINYETQLIKPIYVTPDGAVVVANEPNGTLELYDANLVRKASLVLGHGICSITGPEIAADVEPNELWVTVRHQQAIAIIDLTGFRVVDWVRPPIALFGVGYGDADHLGQVAFSDAALDKAYVSCFETDRVAVFQRSTHAFLGTIALSLVHNGTSSDLNTPYSMLVVEKDLYVVSHLSGNQTMSDFGVPQPGPQAPDGVAIRDLTTDPARSQPDFDVMQIDTTTDTVIGHWKGVGTVNFNLAYVPDKDRLVVSNLELQNGKFLGEGAFPNGQVGLNRLTYIDRTAPPAGPHLIVNTETLGGISGNHAAQPTDVLVDSFGRVVVAAYGSSRLGVFDASGNYLGVVKTAAGPRGLALGPQTLYVLCRGTDQVQAFPWGATLPTSPSATVNLVDPTPENIKAGRQLFIDSSHSGLGTTSCNTCHVDARKDGLGWDLSKYHDPGSGFTLNAPPGFFDDRKGVMVTQDLRSLPEVTPFHWRGEQHDLNFFNAAFVGLLHGTSLGGDQFRLFQDFVFSARYTPNGQQMLNRDYTAGAINIFQNDGCFRCHALPLGTGNDETLLLQSASPFVSMTAQLRALHAKESARCNVNNLGGTQITNMTGFGLLHNGTNPDIDDFINVFFGGPLAPGRKAMLREFDTGLAPAAVYSELLNAATAGSIMMSYMTTQANAGNCDLAGRGRINTGVAFQNVGMLWDPATATFRFDDSGLAPITSATALSMAAAGNLEAVMICTPVWSGERVGLDLDRDGINDRDEVLAGLDPTNPDSDGDGLWESCDPNPSVPSPPPPGTVGVFNLQTHLVTTNTVKVTWETRTFSPTRLVYGQTVAYGASAGDPFPINLAPNTSRLWKRKHTAYLRMLEDGILYHFAVVTQGQNGLQFQTADQQILVNADFFNPNERATVVSLTQVGAAPNITWAATVQVTDNHGNPVVGVPVTGVFTHFIGGNPITAFTPLPVNTGPGGFASFSNFFSGQSPGDISRFTIPQLLDLGGGVMVPPVGNTGGPFEWPESNPTRTETTVL